MVIMGILRDSLHFTPNVCLQDYKELAALSVTLRRSECQVYWYGVKLEFRGSNLPPSREQY